MRKFKGSIGTGMQGSRREFEFEVGDDATEDEIEETARELAYNFVDWGFVEVDEEEGR